MTNRQRVRRHIYHNINNQPQLELKISTKAISWHLDLIAKSRPVCACGLKRGFIEKVPNTRLRRSDWRSIWLELSLLQGAAG